MPLITSKQVWTQQPQHAVEIDWANPLSKDLIAAFVFSNGLRDLVTGQFAENKGGIFVDSPLGRCFKAITAGISLPWDLNCTSADITITAVEYKTQTTNGYWFIADARSGSYGYVYGNDDVLLSPSGTLTRPGYKVSSFCKNEFYQEGVKTSYVNDAQPSPRSNLRFLGRYNDENPYANSAVAAIYLHRRTITQAEHISLYENPWRLLKRQDKRIWVPSAASGITIACTPGNATTAGITAGISSATIIACNAGTATTAGISAGISSATTISCNAGTASTTGISAGITQATTIACNAGTATVAGIPAGISLNSSITISCNAGAATTAGVSAVFPQTLSCTPGNATTAGNSATFPQSLSCNVGNATTAGITAQVDIAGQIVIGCNAGTATTAGASANISSAIVLACNAGTATTLGTTAYFPQALQCSPGNAIAVGIDATFTVAGPTTIVCNVGNATASGISFSFAGTLVDAPNGSGPAIIIPRGTRGAVQNTTRPPNIGGIRI